MIKRRWWTCDGAVSLLYDIDDDDGEGGGRVKEEIETWGRGLGARLGRMVIMELRLNDGCIEEEDWRLPLILLLPWLLSLLDEDYCHDIWWGWLGLVNRVSFYLSSLDSFPLKTSSSSSTLETLVQWNNYGNNIFHKLLFLDRLYS